MIKFRYDKEQKKMGRIWKRFN